MVIRIVLACVFFLMLCFSLAGCDGVARPEVEYLHSVGFSFESLGKDVEWDDRGKRENWLPGTEEYPGGEASGDGWIFFPFWELLDEAGNVYVADRARIQKFDGDGLLIAQIAVDEELRELKGRQLYNRYYDKMMSGDKSTILFAETEWFDDNNLLVKISRSGDNPMLGAGEFYVVPVDLSEMRHLKLHFPAGASFVHFSRARNTGDKWFFWTKDLAGGTSEQWAARLKENEKLEAPVYLGSDYAVTALLPDGRLLCSLMTSRMEDSTLPDFAVTDFEGRVFAKLSAPARNWLPNGGWCGFTGEWFIADFAEERGENGILRVYDQSLNEVARLELPEKWRERDSLNSILSIQTAGERMLIDFNRMLDTDELAVFSVDWPSVLKQKGNDNAQ